MQESSLYDHKRDSMCGFLFSFRTFRMKKGSYSNKPNPKIINNSCKNNNEEISTSTYCTILGELYKMKNKICKVLIISDPCLEIEVVLNVVQVRPVQFNLRGSCYA